MRHPKHPVTRAPLLAAAVGLAALAASGCGSTSTTAAAPTTTTVPAAQATSGTAATVGSAASSAASSSAPTTSPSRTVTTAPSSGGARTSGTPACRAQDLSISLGQREGAAGTQSVAIVFRNNSLGNCSLRGYPGVDGLADNGPASSPTSQIPAVRDSSGAPVSTVVIDPGQEASALVLASDIPTGGATSCPSFTGFEVTPPNTTATTRLPGALQLCDGLRVRPIVAGAAGE